MSATVHKLRPEPMERAACSKCGIEATCGCNAPYLTAGERAAAAVAANPGKSDRTIAAEIGVSDKTVAAARRSTADHSAVRQGADGKVRKMPTPKVVEPKAVQPPVERPLPASGFSAQVVPVGYEDLHRNAAFWIHNHPSHGPKHSGEDVAEVFGSVVRDVTQVARMWFQLVPKQQSEMAQALQSVQIVIASMLKGEQQS